MNGETIFNRNDSTSRKGGFDLHAADPRLTPEWIVQAARESKAEAVAGSVAIESVNEQYGDTIIPFRQNELHKNPEDMITAEISARGYLITADYRPAEIQLRDAA